MRPESDYHPAMATNHRWKFVRAGGLDQVALRDGEDVVHVPELDPKLWVALAMPTRGVELDPRTLDHVDADKDGRIRVPEIREAIEFIEAALTDPDEILRGDDVLPLSSIKDEGVLAAAKRVLAALGKADATSIDLADIDAHAKIVAQLRLNGDGVLPPGVAEDAETEQVIRDILDTVGGVADKGGETGADQAGIDAFFAAAQSFLDWHVKGESDKTLLPLGEATFAAAEATNAVRAKIGDYFVRCRLAGLDARASAALNGSEADFTALAAKQLDAADPDVARLPLARIDAGRPLQLKDGLNPAWAGPMASFVNTALGPLLRPTAHQLAESDWHLLEGKLAAHEAWVATRPASPVDKLGAQRLQAILAGPTKTRLAELVTLDRAQEGLNQEVADVDKLILYRRDLYELLNNFVNFAWFYARRGATFQAGTLFLDERSCTLCMEVVDPAKHATLAAMAGMYLAYCDLTRPQGEKKTIVAAFTGGDGDNLFVGRNGVFFDRKGRDWDATITKVVSNPISLREAFWSPYKKLARMIDQQVAKRGEAAEADSTAVAEQAATATAHPETAKPPEAKKIDVGTVAAIGVAVAGFGAMVGTILGAFFGLGIWMPLGFLALVLLISLPSVLLAWLKLRRRNLGPLLDANGWAINGRARINVPFGGALTDVASLPRGSERSLDDPFAEKRRPWKLYLVLALIVILVVSWYLGKLDSYLPGPIRSTSVLGDSAPAAKPPEPPKK